MNEQSKWLRKERINFLFIFLEISGMRRSQEECMEGRISGSIRIELRFKSSLQNNVCYHSSSYVTVITVIVGATTVIVVMQ